MTELNYNIPNIKYDIQMTCKYESKIHNRNLEIEGDPEITNLRFLEKFDIQTLKYNVSNNMSVKLSSNTITELTLKQLVHFVDKYMQQYVLNLNVDDLELQNLETLVLENNKLENDQLFNLNKFKKLHNLNVSLNNVDLTYIHNIIGLTQLSIRGCGLKNIDQIISLVNLKELDLSKNIGINLGPLCKVTSITKLLIRECCLQINQIAPLSNLEVLDVSFNQLQNIDSLSGLVNLKELVLDSCGLRKLSALKYLVNLRNLNLYNNSNIDVTELQYLKNITHLNLYKCGFVSIHVLRPLMNLQNLNISENKIVYFDIDLNELQKLEKLYVDGNLINDITSTEILLNFNIKQRIRYFDISCQIKPTRKQLRLAQKLRRIENPNILLLQIQNKHLKFKTLFYNFKQQIAVIKEHVHSNHIQNISYIALVFQQMNQSVFQ
ncbi:leucine-rich_repeat domain-containing protein [Hexamita inflata]|uniref:Leucine-rich repeat domain-containing protein n=1 Tax=Hexamita inflata TaxID=28002 RepID=A0AA86QJW8_9EUKA|nr:leucine-rich repeat domain-containing protein [Hexamita inflata]CAI9959678.1 leucine-rich repeat domain-containing protein [Hexamita inflata]